MGVVKLTFDRKGEMKTPNHLRFSAADDRRCTERAELAARNEGCEATFACVLLELAKLRERRALVFQLQTGRKRRRP